MNHPEKAYKISESRINSFVNRTRKRNFTMIAIFMSVFLLLTFWFTYSYHVHTVIMLPLLLMFSVIAIGIYIASFFQLKNIAEETVFYVSEKNVKKIVATGALNMMNQFANNRQEVRYGAKMSQQFPTHEIESTQIKANEIVIKSFDYNVFTGNGKIVIPKELENYLSVKEFILAHPKKFKLIS